MLEANAEIGGATASVRVFPDFDAHLSRYAYLVSLLPDKIIQDLKLNFKCLSRRVASYTPYAAQGKDSGLHFSRVWDEQTTASFASLEGGEADMKAWQNFYGEIEPFAQRIAPTMLKPLPSRSQLKKAIGLDRVWDYLIEEPIGQAIVNNFKT